MVPFSMASNVALLTGVVTYNRASIGSAPNSACACERLIIVWSGSPSGLETANLRFTLLIDAGNEEDI